MMLPFAATMYGESVIFYRNVPATGSQGASTRTFPDAGEDMRASVQSAMVDQTDFQGRVTTSLGYSVYTPSDPQARADDKFEWRFRMLTVVGPTDPKAIGGTTWLTRCVETR